MILIIENRDNKVHTAPRAFDDREKAEEYFTLTIRHGIDGLYEKEDEDQIVQDAVENGYWEVGEVCVCMVDSL